MRMAAFEKEKIFVELRKYHTDEFPERMATSKMQQLREEFSVLEDSIINMLLNLVNGKVAFVDHTAELGAFADRVKVKPSGDRSEDDNRRLFISKIEQLKNVLELGRNSNFTLRVPRTKRTVEKS